VLAASGNIPDTDALTNSCYPVAISNRMSWAAAEARIKYQNIDNEVVFPIMSIFYSFKSLSASMMYHLLSYIK
jgi:hypothetical protein